MCDVDAPLAAADPLSQEGNDRGDLVGERVVDEADVVARLLRQRPPVSPKSRRPPNVCTTLAPGAGPIDLPPQRIHPAATGTDVRTTLAILLAAFFAGAAPLQAQHEHHGEHGAAAPRLGTIRFPNSGAAAAQPAFLRGVALLHSYEYQAAREAFREAQRQDPGFALAYWLEAFAHSQFDWSIEDLPAARAVLARLGATPADRLARAGNDHERALGSAIEGFLTEAPPRERADRFADGIARWLAAAPAELEAQAFATRAALYRLRYAEPAERVARAEAAIALAEGVIAAEPDHPGGIHYLIHATDSPLHAARGLDAARIYDRIAPDADHALHMPSHIYLQLGLWDEVVAANERAWRSSRANAARAGLTAADAGWHSLQWLQYGYLQQGRFAAAAALRDTARALVATLETETLEGFPDVRYIEEQLAFQYAAEVGDWAPFVAAGFDGGTFITRVRTAPSRRERAFAAAAASHAALAALVGNGDAATAAGLARALKEAGTSFPDGDGLRGAIERYAAQVEALIAARDGRADHAIRTLRQIADETRTNALTPVGPPAGIPAFELLALTLLAEGRPAEAAAAYEEALRDRPNRSAAWRGLALARARAGDCAGSIGAYASLLENWHAADTGLPALAEAKRAVRTGCQGNP